LIFILIFFQKNHKTPIREEAAPALMNAMSTGGILPQTGRFVNAFCRKKSRKMKKFPISAGKIVVFQKHPPKAGPSPHLILIIGPQKRAAGKRFLSEKD